MPREQAAGGGASPAASVYDEEDMSLMGTGKQERGYERRRGASGRLKCAFCFSLLLLLLSLTTNVFLASSVRVLADLDAVDLSSYNSVIGALGLSAEAPPVTAFSVSVPADGVADSDFHSPGVASPPVDGRIYLLLSKLSSPEPRCAPTSPCLRCLLTSHPADPPTVPGSRSAASARAPPCTSSAKMCWGWSRASPWR